MRFSLHQGDCLEVLRSFPDASFDSVCCDPPYGIRMMGHVWDYDVPSTDTWCEVLRVLKPGGHLLAFSGSRTYHRMVTNIEDAGFEIRDQIMWVYGSGMPKSKNLHGAWEGWGSALKPAHEPICMARKPLSEGTIAANVLAHGTGAINIDACRIPLGGDADAADFANNHAVTERLPDSYKDKPLGLHDGGWKQRVGEAVVPHARWPANLIHDGSDEVVSAFPSAAGQLAKAAEGGERRKNQNTYGEMRRGSNGADPRGDAGSAARFFYAAKATRKERNYGLDNLPDVVLARSTQAQADAKRGITVDESAGAFNKARVCKNNHATVKPVAVCRWLLTLVTPPGGKTLDPYVGSGSFGVAAMQCGFDFVGIDLDRDEAGNSLGYLDISRQRIAVAQAEAFDAACEATEL